MSKSVQRLHKIKAALDDIAFIANDTGLKSTRMIEDAVIKPALRMHIVKIAEQFNKLKEENAFKLLEAFDPTDLRGMSAVRNFIAHDYDSVDDMIIEDVIRENLPKIKTIVERLIIEEGNDD